MINTFYIQLSVSDEQKAFARQLVEFSLVNHKVSNIWDKDSGSLPHTTRMLRFTGTLGEIVFADFYGLQRPRRSFGAVNGQDWGQDFVIKTNDYFFSLDVKSMKRKNGFLCADYVLNIPASQLHKPGSKTTHYFCLSFHHTSQEGTVASLLGFIDKEAIELGTVGSLYKKGTTRMRADKSSFVFNEDTYEILFKDISPPIITERILKGTNPKKCFLKSGKNERID